jgi:hypothetical protein
MMLPVDLELPLLEQRTYLHGTTLFDAMMSFVPDGAALSFKIQKRIDSDRVRLRADDGASKASASLAWTLGGESGPLVAIELPHSGRARRERYEEAWVEQRAVVQGKTAALREGPPYGMVQALIPLFKALLKREVSTSIPGQWMFTRLDLASQPHTFIPLELTLGGTVPNTLVRAKVACSGTEVGMVYFSWVPRA